MSTQTLTIRQVEQIAIRLHKYRLTPEDADALAQVLAGATNSPVQIQPGDLSALMRPKRPAKPKQSLSPEVRQRRQRLRDEIQHALDNRYFGADALRILHHPDDYATVRSALQYRLAPGTYSTERADDQMVLVTLK